MPKCIIAQRGNYYAHAETIKKAIDDVNFKYLQENLDISVLVSEIKERGTVTANDYRLLTGSCSFGVNQFLKENNMRHLSE